MNYQTERSRHFEQAPGINGILGDLRDDVLYDTYGDEVDTALDAFDQQLLSELPQNRYQQASQGFSRISLPLPTQYASQRSNFRHDIRDDLYQTPLRSTSSSTTIVEQASSPTVSALQNRRSYGGRNKATQDRGPIHAQQSDSGRHAPPTDTYPAGNTTLSVAHAPPTVRGIQLVPTSSLPDQLGSIFPHKLLNVMQSKCFHVAFNTDDNLVLSAPTGSGKTLVMELAICRLWSQSRNGDFKVVYQAPTKALCAERYRDWNKKFGTLGLECAELTGDTEFSNLRQVQAARIIITTPEKWDSVTRKWRDQMKLIQLITLFLVDEVHMLKESRGATLEAVVSRMKSLGTDVRFVALSATVPNSNDIATWLGKNQMCPELPAHREVFDESYRPVKLEKHVYGFKGNSNEFSLDKTFSKEIPIIIGRHSKGKPTMVFCMTRKSAFHTATNLATLFNQTPQGQRTWKKPSRPIAVGDSDLKLTVAAGVAFHHAGLRADDRLAVEQGFLHGDISVICSTSTLAVGINLPCYLVILQGTMSYGDAGPQEYSDLEVMQMLGRAGRPQFEQSACAVILTREEKVNKYREMVSGQQLLESTLHRNLIEHLNAEIGLGTIYDTASAKRWLSSTFLCVRLGQNPAHYHLDEGMAPQSADELLNQICERDVKLLVNHDCVAQQGRLRSTEIGDAMARYYVKFDTMKLFVSIPPKAKTSEILSVLAQAAEFEEVRFKSGERKFYKNLNEASGIKFPVRVNLALTAHKISILLQAELGGVETPVGDEYKKLYAQHHVDKNVVFSHAKRLIRCIIDCQLHLKDAVSARNALELGRSIAAKAWDNTPQQLREIPGVGLVSARKLAARDISSIEDFINTEPERIDLIMGKQQPFGRNLIKAMSDYPALRIAVKEMGREIHNGKGVTLKMKAEVGFINERAPTFFKSRPVSIIFIAEDSEGTLCDFRRLSAQKIRNGEDFLFTVDLTRAVHYLRCSIMCDEIVGTFRYAEAPVVGIPATAFPKGSNPTSITDARARSNGVETITPRDDTFGDDGLDDNDFLVVGTSVDGVETVQDMDNYLSESIGAQKQSNVAKSAPEKSSRDDDEEYREPTRLENGRWTCQHFCRDKGVECKHKCCREGVSKPKPRPRKQSKPKTEEKGQQKITKMASSVRKAYQTGPNQVLDLDTLHELETKKRSLAFEPVASLHSSQDRPRKKQKLLLQDSGASKAETYSTRAKKDSPAVTGSLRLPTSKFDFEDEADVWDANDCDWNNARAITGELDDDWMKADMNGQVEISRESHGGRTQVDYDAHNMMPPVPFLSLADLEKPREKNLFITGQRSSPERAPRSTSTTITAVGTGEVAHRTTQGPEDLHFPASDWGLFEEEDDLDFDEMLRTESRSRQPQKEESQKHNLGSTLQSRNGTDVISFQNGNSKEREKRLWEEDQKKKWEGLDPWMYEQFHEFVELI